MKTLLQRFADDEAGFIVSSELTLIATIAILTLVVGLAEVSYSVNSELKDVATAFDAVNQSYEYDGEDHWFGHYEGDGQYTVDWDDSLDLAGASGEVR